MRSGAGRVRSDQVFFEVAGKSFVSNNARRLKSQAKKSDITRISHYIGIAGVTFGDSVDRYFYANKTDEILTSVNKNF